MGEPAEVYDNHNTVDIFSNGHHHSLLEDTRTLGNIFIGSITHPINPFREAHAFQELDELLKSDVFQGIGIPKGNDQKLLTIPGFWMGDHHLRHLNDFLRRIGYNVYDSGIRHDLPPFARTIKELADKIKRINDATGTPIILVPHSVAGPIATHISKLIPDEIEFQADLAPVYNTSLRVTLPVAAVALITGVGVAVRHGIGAVRRDIELLEDLDEHEEGPKTSKTKDAHAAAKAQDEIAVPTPEALVDVKHVILRAIREGVIDHEDRVAPKGTIVFNVDATHDGMIASVNSFIALSGVLRAHEDSKKIRARSH